MKAKLVREIPQPEGRPYYWREYEFECVECGEHYFSGQYTNRTNPYCGVCRRNHRREEQRKRYWNNRKAIRTLDRIMTEIEKEKIGYPPSGDEYKAICRIMKIIDKYRQEV